ncbi:MAG: MFS transporter [Actinomycetia bacterium]|nr:MFS transporter [Actinomycetes bacterium]
MTAPTIDRTAWLSLAVLAGAFGVVSISLSVMNVAFDALVDEFEGTSTATLGWVLTGYTTVTAAVLIAAGRVADTYGRRRVFLLGLVVYVLTSVAGGLAWSPAALIGARVGQGVGAALVTPASLALLLTIFPPTRRSTVIGIWGAVGAVAAAGGPAVGGLVVDTLGWRWVFWLNIPFCVVALMAGRRWIDESIIDDADGAPDLRGIVLSAAAVGSLALGLAQSGEWGWGDPRTVTALVLGPLLGLLLVRRSAHHPVPVIDLALFRLRSFTVGNVVVLLFMAGFSAMILNNILFLSRVWGYSQAGAGLGITPSPLTAALVAPIAGRVADKIGTRVLIVPGIGLFILGLLFLTFGVGTEARYWTHWFPAALCFGTGVGLTFTNVSSATIAEAPPKRLAIASATFGTARAIGAVLGPAFVIGTIGDARGVGAADRFDRVWLVAAAVAFVALLAARQLPDER